MASGDKDADKPTRRRGFAVRLWRLLLLIVDICAVAALFASGYAGLVSPLKHGGIMGIVGLTFPIVLGVVLLLFILQLFTHRRGLWILGFGMVLCAGPILTYSPLNIRFKPRLPAPGDTTFTVLSYNVANLIDQRPYGSYDRSYNAIVSYILERDADIVCLAECKSLGVSDSLRITEAQYDSLRLRYPYIIMSGRAQATLSKFPLQPISVAGFNRNTFSGGDIGIYRVTLPSGKLMTLFSVHLQSLGLNNGDKELYMDLTELESDDLHSVRTQLLSKIAAANVKRAEQASLMLGVIRHYGGNNVIICGDFNDIPNCYAIRTFGDAGLKSVYPELGFGPIVTFNANRFYFCIDHMLYRGDLRPLTFRKGDTEASDHYPIEVRFEVK